MKTYVKKPIPVKAIQVDDNFLKDIEAKGGKMEISNYTVRYDGYRIYVETLEGIMSCNKGDYIIIGVRGEIYPCAKEIFEETYEEIKS